MSLSLRLSRTVVAITPDRVGPEFLRLSAFFAVEGLAELCRRHLLATSDLSSGLAAALLAASMAMGWAYLAHQRLAFRGWAPTGKLVGAGVFVITSLGCLDGELLLWRLAPLWAAAIWLAATGLKFGLVRRLVWGGQRPRIEVAP